MLTGEPWLAPPLIRMQEQDGLVRVCVSAAVCVTLLEFSFLRLSLPHCAELHSGL